MNEVNRNPYYDFVGTTPREDTAIIMEDIANKIYQLKILFPECMDNNNTRKATFDIIDNASTNIMSIVEGLKRIDEILKEVDDE